MVNYSSHSLNATFAALADPTRRAILARLVRGDSSVTKLAKPFAVSLPAISKHLGVLEQAGLVARERDGRVRRCRLLPGPMQEAAAWIVRYRRFWENRLDALAQYLEESRQKEDTRWPARITTLKRPSSSRGASRPRGRRSSRPGRTRKP